MNHSEQKTASSANDSQIVSDIHEMFERYGPTFVDLVVGKRLDMNALLEFYEAPLRFVGATFHMIMKDDAAITGPDGMGGEIDRLRQANFAESTLETCNVSLLNAQAALVDALWLRRDAKGALMERFAVIYLVALTAEGWRITSAVNTVGGTFTGKEKSQKDQTSEKTMNEGQTTISIKVGGKSHQ